MAQGLPPDGAGPAPRPLSSRALFALVYTTSVSSVYFALGVVADRALGLTPVVFLVAGLFFALSAMTYVEGAALHRERGGSSVFARYAFNELVSFVAGWAILLDYAILVAVTAFTTTNYMAEFWSPLGSGLPEVLVAIAIIVAVAIWNVAGVTIRQLQQQVVVAAADIGVQVVVIVLGLFLIVEPGVVLDSIELGATPSNSDVVFALTIATIAFTGLEAAASLAGESRASRRELKRLVGPGVASIVLVYVGIAVVAVNALPVTEGASAFTTRDIEAPLLGIADSFDPNWLSDTLQALVALSAVTALVAASNGAMLGTSRLAYALATNRQIPSRLGRLHPRFGTPYVLIALAALIAAVLTIPADLDFLVGIYAFGALLAFTIAHLAIVVLRFREPDRSRPYRVPLNVRVRGRDVPLPAVLGALLSGAGWVTVVILHGGARYVGLAWLLGGIVLYVVYRRIDGNPLLRRVMVPERALRHERDQEEFGSILVPIFGNALDDDIVQTAGRLAGTVRDDLDEEGATIEAIWVFEVPMALPIDARLPEAQVRRAQEALRRAKAVGEEYEGVQVQTAMIRARRAGQGIVSEAKRRGVEAIVLAAEEPSRVRGGALLGGSGGPLDNFVGEATKYVLRKAECRVILTAPAADQPNDAPR
ncbi:universal stress protein [Conexibacter woesei]|uniref:UspA domain protein n=1 Tax=Conexibacter woesei (strain DSM 14684 / CCUG 47730 / CIP 108061 / JCM 11494 / NBRC 100937 / ID131577) TaxID=469383 RepID=D3FBR4_CONWI|nr:universal stress protein [Conexibacter woesei]ADB51329.1 UspA domain protein [Conexibacter woesei DSM 14684]